MPIKKKRPKKIMPGIYQDGPDRFMVRVTWIDQKTGRKRDKEAVTTTLEEAVAIKERPHQHETKGKLERKRFSDFGEQWLEDHGSRYALSTQERLSWAMEHLDKTFGDYFVDTLVPKDIRQWRDKPPGKLAPATVNGYLRVLRVMLDDAVEDGILEWNPARATRARPEGPTSGPRGRTYTVSEFRRFLEGVEELKASWEISSDIARLILTIALTGIRKGEALALKWPDVARQEVELERSVWRGNEKSTKTGEDRRLALITPLKKVFEEQRQWLTVTHHPGLESRLVFPASPKHIKSQRKGDWWHRGESVLRKPLKRIVEMKGLPEVTPHSFRRTWENTLRKAGVDQQLRKSMAGWRSDSAQAGYTEFEPEERLQAAESVLDLVMGESGTQGGTRNEKEERPAEVRTLTGRVA